MQLGLGIGITSIRRGGASALDPDAAAYIAAVETADGEALEEGVKTAINDFVVGCKADSIWAALKASCILAGARTLSGALVPLVGAAPTNVNFVSGDYNRKTGLVGNRSTKYLNSNRASNDDPQNDQHLAVYAGAARSNSATFETLIGGRFASSTLSEIICGSSDEVFFRSRNVAQAATPISSGIGSFTGFCGMSRDGATSFSGRVLGVDYTSTIVSRLPLSGDVHVFNRSGGSSPTDARLSFYSIGESLDLAALDARVSALMTALDGAIA